VRRLVLVSAAGLGREVAWSYRLATLPGMELLAAYFLGGGRLDRRGMEAFGRAMCYDPARLPADWAAQRQAIWATPGAVEAFYATARAGLSLAGQRVDFSPRLPQVRQPTLLVWGRQDATIPVAHALAAARALPDARLHVFERCGHMPMWEYPGAFAETVLDFLG
jgi:4,5:9,10-diseco-3-hydroxy-5,9,17-trioxoandrosta-1(10),2-diene-4-oate hydrolase